MGLARSIQPAETSKHQAVDKMFWLEAGPLNVGTRNVVWLCRPKLSYMRIIAGELGMAPYMHRTIHDR